MINTGSSEQPASTGGRRRIHPLLGATRAVVTLVTLVTLAATAMPAGAASAASAIAATQAAENDGKGVGDTLIGTVVVLGILVALFLIIRRLRRRG